MLVQLLATLTLGFLSALVFTPIVRAIAIRMGIVDHPDNHRKLHQRVVARAGGTVVLLSVLLVAGIGAVIYFDWRLIRAVEAIPYFGLLAGMIAIWLVGLADDVWNLRGRQKLAGQFLVAGLLAATGFTFKGLSVQGWDFNLGWLSIPFSMVWLLACMNALNLIDGADGLCSTIGAIVFAALGLLAAMQGHLAESIIAFGMCGALLGFLCFNFPPASVFLGDSGSLLIGLVAGALSVRCSLKGPTSAALVVPLCILFLPLLDSTMAIVRRKLTGRSIYTTDRAHFHHMLRSRGIGDRMLLAIVVVIGAFTAGAAVIGHYVGKDWVGLAGVFFVFGMLIKTKAFGYSEMVLLAKRGYHFLLSFLEPAKRCDEITRERVVRLQGSRQWDKAWQTMVEFAEREKLAAINMDLNVPWLEEGYHGAWHRSKQPERRERWTVSLPLFASGRICGSINVSGLADQVTMLGSLNRLSILIDDLGPQIQRIIDPAVPAEVESYEPAAPSSTVNDLPTSHANATVEPVTVGS